MATENPMESLQEQATCPICLEYFKDPVTIDCRHNFCRDCIKQCWERQDTAASCPQCRETVQQGNLRPNRKLANMIAIAKRLSLQAAKGAGGERLCGEHQEALKLFCEKDQTPICLVCYLSPTHRAHKVVPTEEAAQEYKGKIRDHLKTLRKEREKLLGLKETGEKENRKYLKHIEKERQKTVSEFQQLRQFLEEQERLLLAQLEKLEEMIVKIQKENITKLSEEISCLSKLISDLEEKYKKPASEFLQDVRSTLSRCEKGKFQQPVKISPGLEKRLSDFSQKTVALMETVRQFKDTLPYELETKRVEPVGAHRLVNVTLDPNTAHPQLVLSKDWKSVRWGDTCRGGSRNCSAPSRAARRGGRSGSRRSRGSSGPPADVPEEGPPEPPAALLRHAAPSTCLACWGLEPALDTWQQLPNNPERFDYCFCVLGFQGFTSGRHCWEVDVGHGGHWAVGVAKVSVRRKGWISLNPEGGIWAVQRCRDQFWGLTSPEIPLSLSQVPSRIRVYLDCNWGQVKFINADDEAPIFTFPPGSIPKERIRPWLWVGRGSRLRLCR